MAKTYTLPDGETTEDPTTYGDALCALGDALAETLGEGYQHTGGNTGTLCIVHGSSDPMFGERVLEFPFETATRLVKHYQNFLKTNLA